MEESSNYHYTQLDTPIQITEQNWPKGVLPVVTTRTITYMHEPYIRDCIEGILMQKTTFPVEVVIHDDASTDKTANIIREYEAKYPHLIKAIYQKENQFSKPNKGAMIEDIKKETHGKYFASCEGDDYWTDPYKLQKQVDFLENNPEYSACFHNAEVIYEKSKRKPHPFAKFDKDIYTINDVIEKDWFIPTQSIVFRKESFKQPDWFGKIMHGDFALLLILALKGPLFCINEQMSVYRRTGNSIANSTSFIYRSKKKIELLHYFNMFTQFIYYEQITKKINYEMDSYYRIKMKNSNKILYYISKIIGR